MHHIWQVNVFKEPITDMGKKSKKGRLTLEHENGEWVTKQEGTGSPDKVPLTTQKCYRKSTG